MSHASPPHLRLARRQAAPRPEPGRRAPRRAGRDRRDRRRRGGRPRPRRRRPVRHRRPRPEAEQIVYRALLAWPRSRPWSSSPATTTTPAGSRRWRRCSRSVGSRLLGQVARPGRRRRASTSTLGGVPVRLALLPFLSQRGIVRADALCATRPTSSARPTTSGSAPSSPACAPGSPATRSTWSAATSSRPAAPGRRRAVGPHGLRLQVGAARLPGHRPVRRPRPPPPAPRNRRPHRSATRGSPCSSTSASPRRQVGHHRRRRARRAGGRARGRRSPPAGALRTLTGSLAELDAARGTTGDDYLRVVVSDTRRAGLADEVRAWFEHAVDVVVRVPDADDRPGRTPARPTPSPSQLFGAYLARPASTTPVWSRRSRPCSTDVTASDAEVPA